MDRYFAGGLDIYNHKTNDFKHPDFPMLSDYTSVMYLDRRGNIWIGRDKGIDVIERSTGLVKHYVNQPNNPNSLVANNINSIIQDHSGLFWIGTKEGLSILNTQTGRFINIEEQQGLPSNNIWNVREDNNGLIWMSTANGLANIKLKITGTKCTYQIHKYNETDGLQGSEFNANAALKTKSGDLIFGGDHGFNIFNPENINSFNLKPQLVFTDFQLFNRSIGVGDTIAGNVVLTKSITTTC